MAQALDVVPRIAEPTSTGKDGPAALLDHYEREFPRVFGYILYRVQNRTTADDLTSRVFLRALGRYQQFNPEDGSFSTWILAIARNAVNDHLRRLRRRRWVSLDLLRGRAARDPGPEDLAIHEERRARLLAALRRLPERQRDILGLKFAGGQTNRAIACLTGLSESHVGVLVYRAVRKLKTEVGKEVDHA